MTRPTLTAVLYFLIVFAAGFVLGTARVLFIAPAIGDFSAALVETPLILTVSWLTCGWLVGKFDISGLAERLWLGAVAFILVIGAEAALGVYGFGRAWAEQVHAFLQPVGLVGLAGQILFALIPAVRRPASGVRRPAGKLGRGGSPC